MATATTTPTATGFGELGVLRHHINGRFRDSASGATFETLNPATLRRTADGIRAPDTVRRAYLGTEEVLA
jgi:hypothetical protein